MSRILMLDFMPELINEWSNKNTVDPWTFTKGSGIKVWWTCASGHEWQASPNTRTKGHGCKSCSRPKQDAMRRKAAARRNPLPEYLRNELVVDKEISANSGKKEDWKCARGHIYSATPNHRMSGSGCPKCANSYKSALFIERAYQISPVTTKGNVKPLCTLPKLSTGSEVRMAWTCDKGHIWIAVPRSIFILNTGCPSCAWSGGSKGENEVADFVSSLGYAPTRNRRDIVSPLELDIFIDDIQVAIEYNGTYWHSLPNVIERDLRKKVLCRQKGIRLLIVSEDDWACRQEQAKENIKAFLSESSIHEQ